MKKLPLERLLIYAWNPLVIVEVSSSGHVDALAVLLFYASLLALELGRSRAAGFTAGLGFLSKFSTILLVPWLLVKQQTRRAIPLMAAAVVVGGLIYWPDVRLGLSPTSGLATYAAHWTFNSSVYAFTTTAPVSAVFVKTALAMLLGLVGFILAKKMSGVVAYAGVMWAVGLVLSPVVYPWYVLGLVPALCFYPRWSGLAFTGLVFLSYLVLKEFAASGLWQLPAWVPWVEYGIPALLLMVEVSNGRKAVKSGFAIKTSHHPGGG